MLGKQPSVSDPVETNSRLAREVFRLEFIRVYHEERLDQVNNIDSTGLICDTWPVVTRPLSGLEIS